MFCVDGFMPDKSSKDNDIHNYQLNVVLPITSFHYDCLQFTMQYKSPLRSFWVQVITRLLLSNDSDCRPNEDKMVIG